MTQAPAGTLYVVVGMPAVGKTTFARRLAKELGTVLIDIDVATEPIIRAAMKAINGNPDDRDSTQFKTIFREPIYAALFALANANLPYTSAAVSAPFTKEMQDPHWPETIMSIVPNARRVTVLWLHADSATVKARMEQRGEGRDRPKLEDWENTQRYYTGCQQPTFPHVDVDTTAPDCFEQALLAGKLDG
ncbi:AAA domain [Carpediemonas membranifera]|uniref:AAA domain n=1 Tax=Carpediemonas membranifera TaxID=201153 RepID=A0A8J6E2I7_9EUKA|nr:AAA domain [Carpediemonas membranifera]|eukprot:KAG9391957.1 AAA domain [Carpediemonas membranifera]